MIIFVTSDIHGRMDVVEKIRGFLAGREYIDCLILCGDITGDYIHQYFHELEEMQLEDYKAMIEELKPLNRKMIFIQGNHDVFCVDKDDEYYLSYNTDKDFRSMVPLEYLNFSMYGMKREGSEEDMKNRLSKLKINETSIIISHMPPHKCLDKSKNGINYGSRAIRDIIKDRKPAYFFCGHVHDAFGYKKLYNTKIFNVACDSNTARGWVVDLETGRYEKVVL